MDKSARKTTTVRLHPDLWESVQIQAIRERRSASDILEAALLLYFSEVSHSHSQAS